MIFSENPPREKYLGQDFLPFLTGTVSQEIFGGGGGGRNDISSVNIYLVCMFGHHI